MSPAPLWRRPWAGLSLVGFAYVIASLVASVIAQLTPGWHPLQTVAAADVAATLCVFVFSRSFDNSSFYDPYWSIAPAGIAAWLTFGPGVGAGLTLRQAVIVGLVLLYAVRLTWNWARGWEGLRHEDWRYVDLRKKTGRLYWLVSFVGIHFFPTVLVFLGITPLHAALVNNPGGFGPLDVIATVVTLGAIVIEGVADEQLRAFRLRENTAGKICDVGLWAWSRHPNYFGEITFWVGLWLFGVAAGAPAWTIAGPLAMVALFLGVSIPMIERRSLARRPSYVDHQRRVSKLLLWPPRRS